MIRVDYGRIQTKNSRMQELLSLAETVAQSSGAIFVFGESGVGKSALAQYIHEKSTRRSRPFIQVIGHQFNAQAIDKAMDGTLYIKAIETMSFEQQTKLTQWIEDGTLRARLISSSSKMNYEDFGKFEFSSDLFYKLSVLRFSVPSLRERRDDILFLAKFFADTSRILHSREQKDLSVSAEQKLLQWNFKGNVRELENVIERAVLLSKQPLLTAEDIIFGEPKTAVVAEDFGPGMTLWEAEKKLILQTLTFTEQNRTRAAQLLGISIRTLRNKINEYQQAGVL